VATALLFLHSAQDAVIHRDLKPANILLDEHMRAKLTDVGLAALLPAVAPDTSAIALTHATTRILGSPQVEPQPFLTATKMVFVVDTIRRLLNFATATVSLAGLYRYHLHPVATLLSQVQYAREA
jgi:serine/threonine protein kinase